MIAITVFSLKPARTSLMTAVFVIGVDDDWAMADVVASKMMSAMAALLSNTFIEFRFMTTDILNYHRFLLGRSEQLERQRPLLYAGSDS